MDTRQLALKVLSFIEAERGNLPVGQLPTVGCVVLHVLAESVNARHRDVIHMFDGMRFLRTRGDKL